VTSGHVSAILLDAGGVLLFPQPTAMLPPLRSAGVSPDLGTLERAHYRAMSRQDRPDCPEPTPATWWSGYLLDYVAECGVAADRCAALVTDMTREIVGFGWTHVGPSAAAGLRALAGLGIPLGVVSNSDGTVQAELHRLGVCYPADGHRSASATGPAAGVEVGVVIDSAVVGVSKPDPEIFRIALDALGLTPSETILHVGDSLRYDVAGALAAGLRPVHLDPYGFCPAPDGHAHVSSLTEVAGLAAAHP
jgi:putative hydrolase of the HAD superfamily